MRRLVVSFLVGLVGLTTVAPAASAYYNPYGNDGGCERGTGLAAGQPVQILWGSSWWEGSVVATQGASTLVHYAGWSSSWDEWVEPARVRVVTPVQPAYEPVPDPYVWTAPRNEPAREGRWHQRPRHGRDRYAGGWGR